MKWSRQREGSSLHFTHCLLTLKWPARFWLQPRFAAVWNCVWQMTQHLKKKILSDETREIMHNIPFPATAMPKLYKWINVVVWIIQKDSTADTVRIKGRIIWQVWVKHDSNKNLQATFQGEKGQCCGSSFSFFWINPSEMWRRGDENRRETTPGWEPATSLRARQLGGYYFNGAFEKWRRKCYCRAQ